MLYHSGIFNLCSIYNININYAKLQFFWKLNLDLLFEQGTSSNAEMLFSIPEVMLKGLCARCF